jgi:hypothetical protein
LFPFGEYPIPVYTNFFDLRLSDREPISAELKQALLLAVVENCD